jgi:CBS domain-containing protein
VAAHEPLATRSAATAACANERVGREHAADLRVRDAMVARPKTLPADATVGTLRALFANPHVTTALLVDSERFVGAIDRAQLPDGIPDDAPARALAVDRVPTIGPDAPLSEAFVVLDALGENRLVVLDPDGDRLRGLLCLTRDRRGFCQS